MNHISKNLRYLRESLGKSKSWVGREIGRSSTVVADYEAGKVSPPVEILMKYAELFEVKPGDLIDRDLETEGPSEKLSEQSSRTNRSRVEREKDLLHQELDLRLEEIRILHESIRKKPEALAELKALDPELYEELERMFPRE